MKLLTWVVTLLIAMSSVVTGIYGQSNASSAIDYITGHAGSFAEAKTTQEELRISSSHISSISGVEHIYIQQTKNGIDIRDAYASVHIDPSGKVLHSQNSLVEVTQEPRQLRRIHSSTDAVSSAGAHYNLATNNLALGATRKPNKGPYERYTDPALSSSDIRVKQVYLYDDGILTLAKEVVLDIPGKDERWAVYIDASTGDVIEEEPLFLRCSFGEHDECGHDDELKAPTRQRHRQYNTTQNQLPHNSYKVYPIPLEGPHEGPRSVVTAPWLDADLNGISPSPYGWHDLDGLPGADTTITQGNNVIAVEDTDANNQGGMSPDGGAFYQFDYPINLNFGPETYIPGSTVNLFYMNNILHDVMTHYGFDEAAGNFQKTNYSGQGEGDDRVRAECQDGSSTNNALFFSNIDGFEVRMQMYQWEPSKNIEINAPEIIAGTYTAGRALYGPQDQNITGQLALTDPVDACISITNPNDISGKIAVIDRGSCQFDEKTREAEDNGAIGVIICNNQPGAGVISMSGDDTTITIPSMMLSYENCEDIKVHIPQGVTVDINMSGINTDSDLDNGIIAHEYGHGISQRLTGGAGIICLAGVKEQMGEGWSDFYALMFQLKPGDLPTDKNGIGTYVLGQETDGDGIRRYPYTTDMDINPFTYNDISTQSVPHGVGTVWCTMLWDMTWNLIEKHGYDPNIYTGEGGNGIAMKLVTEGLKLQPCKPGFIDGRDAILKADTLLFGGSNSCEIWRAFARRGLGIDAEQGDPNNTSDGVESYDIPTGCPEQYMVECSQDSLSYTSITIPDNTDEKVYTMIMIDDSDISSNSSVVLRAQQGIEITSTFEVASSAELLISADPCDNNN